MKLRKETFEVLDSYGYTINDVVMAVIYTDDYVWTDIEDIPHDFKYDNGYGIQEVEGIILMKDNTWFARESYDGSEWWDYKRAPTTHELRIMARNARRRIEKE